MARRKSQIVKRFQKIRGMPGDEKQLLIRLGELIDGIINNRSPSNPFEPGRTRIDRKLPPPTVVTNEAGIKSAKLSWPAINSSILNHYKIVVINLDNGTEEQFVSYTNSFIFKGREGGNYKALVQSVGRNGTQSMPSVIDFFIPEDVMLIEGTKNGPFTIGDVVQEDFFLSTGHKVFVWGSFTIDRLIAGAFEGNPEVALRLYRSEADAGIENATLIQEIPLFAATESATCLASDALGGGILRPDFAGTALTDPNYVRGTTFETCHSVMFGPIDVTTELGERTHSFFLQAVGRELPNDIASLSIVLWSANAGEANQIPSDPFEQEPPLVEEWERSIEVHTTNDLLGAEWLYGPLANNFNFIGNQWTFAVWVKWRRLGRAIGEFANLFQRWQPVTVSPFGLIINSFSIAVTRFTGFIPSDFYVSTSITIGDGRNGLTGSPIHQGNWEARNSTSSGLNAFNPDANPPYGVVGLPLSVWGNLNTWVLFAATFNPIDGIRAYSFWSGKTGPPEITPIVNDTNSGLINPTIVGRRSGIWFGSPGSLGLAPAGEIDDFTQSIQNPANCRVHVAGMWNKVLDVLELTELYNSGDGAGVNWRSKQGLYESQGSLLHYWQFGAINDQLRFVGRDTGINPLGSGGNDGDMDFTETGANPPTTQTFATGFDLTNVVDDAPQ